MNHLKIFSYLLATVLVTALPAPTLAAGSTTKKASTAQSSSSKKASTEKSAPKSTSKSTAPKNTSSKGSPSKSSAKESSAKESQQKSSSKKSTASTQERSKKSATKDSKDSSDKNCKKQKVKVGKAYQYVTTCEAAPKSSNSKPSAPSTQPPAPTLTGGATALPRPENVPEVKVRKSPDRAYAVDGSTFFFKGKKYHIKGANPDSNDTQSDLAKQRLQNALDKGSISTEQLVDNADGSVEAIVRINGRNLADMIKSEE